MQDQRTIQQNKALHLWFRMLANTLNENGVDMATILSKFIIDIPATEHNIKEDIFKPVMFAMYGKRSTTNLLKKEEIDRLVDVICKFLGEMKIECPVFPSIEENIF